MFKFLWELLFPRTAEPAPTLQVPTIQFAPKPEARTVQIPTIPRIKKRQKPTHVLVYKYPTPFEALAEVQENKCFHCANEMVMTTTIEARRKRNEVDTGQFCTKDHIIPVSEQKRRGWHIPVYENTILACEKCNMDRQSEPLSESDLELAHEINAMALHLYRTETVIGTHRAAPRIFGVADPNERELRSLVRHRWKYLFKDATKLSEIRPKLSGTATNQLGQSGTVGKRRDHAPIQLPTPEIGRAHPKTALDFVFPVHAGNKEMHGRAVEFGVP